MDAILLVGFIAITIYALVALYECDSSNGLDIRRMCVTIGAWVVGSLMMLIIGATVIGPGTINETYVINEHRTVTDEVKENIIVTVGDEQAEVPVTRKHYDVITYCTIELRQDYRMSFFLDNEATINLEKACSVIDDNDRKQFIQPHIDNWTD